MTNFSYPGKCVSILLYSYTRVDVQLELGARVFKAQAYKGTENSKQLVTTESLPGLKAFYVPPRDTKTP